MSNEDRFVLTRNTRHPSNQTRNSTNQTTNDLYDSDVSDDQESNQSTNQSDTHVQSATSEQSVDQIEHSSSDQSMTDEADALLRDEVYHEYMSQLADDLGIEFGDATRLLDDILLFDQSPNSAVLPVVIPLTVEQPFIRAQTVEEPFIESNQPVSEDDVSESDSLSDNDVPMSVVPAEPISINRLAYTSAYPQPSTESIPGRLRTPNRPRRPNTAIKCTTKFAKDRKHRVRIQKTIIEAPNNTYHTLETGSVPPVPLEQPLTHQMFRPIHRPYLITPAHIARGWDYQNIDWRRIRESREGLRDRRDLNYPLENAVEGLIDSSSNPTIGQSIELTESFQYFKFASGTQAINPLSFHFQLRHLVHAINNHSMVSLTSEGKIDCLQVLTNKASSVFDLVEYNKIITSIGLVPDTQLMFVGGRDGEYWLVDRQSGKSLIGEQRLTQSEQAITNAITCFDDLVGGSRALLSSNDCFTRLMDVETVKSIQDFTRDVPINYAVASPDGRLVLMLGDSKTCWLVDTVSGRCIHELTGHTDHSFSGAWHPNGIEFATASQDCTARIWDLRSVSQSVSQLAARVSPIRSIKYSHDGVYLLYAEAADYIHIRSTSQLYRGQLIDCFGEINGFDVSCDDSALFFGVCDSTYGGIMEWTRNDGHQLLDIF